MSLTKLVKSNHGTFSDHCPRKIEKVPPQSSRLVHMGKKTTTDGEGWHHHDSICKFF